MDEELKLTFTELEGRQSCIVAYMEECQEVIDRLKERLDRDKRQQIKEGQFDSSDCWEIYAALEAYLQGGTAKDSGPFLEKGKDRIQRLSSLFHRLSDVKEGVDDLIYTYTITRTGEAVKPPQTRER